MPIFISYYAEKNYKSPTSSLSNDTGLGFEKDMNCKVDVNDNQNNVKSYILMLLCGFLEAHALRQGKGKVVLYL